MVYYNKQIHLKTPVTKLFSDSNWPIGEILDYSQNFNTFRKSNTEKKI